MTTGKQVGQACRAKHQAEHQGQKIGARLLERSPFIWALPMWVTLEGLGVERPYRPMGWHAHGSPLPGASSVRWQSARRAAVPPTPCAPRWALAPSTLAASNAKQLCAQLLALGCKALHIDATCASSTSARCRYAWATSHFLR